MLTACLTCQAEKTTLKLQIDNKAKSDTEDSSMTRGSFMVASECPTCNNGYKLDQITFSGFDKPQSSNKETFFITNNTDRTMSGVTLYIEYLMPDGRQLHKRFVKLACNIPPGETRATELNSWDKQKSFYFEKSTASKRAGTPFTVRFDPVAYYLRF